MGRGVTIPPAETGTATAHVSKDVQRGTFSQYPLTRFLILGNGKERFPRPSSMQRSWGRAGFPLHPRQAQSRRETAPGRQNPLCRPAMP